MTRFNHTQSLHQLSSELLTEVSPEQAAIVEGGLRVTLTQIRCIQAGADGGDFEEVFASFNGVDNNAGRFSFAQPTSMKATSVANAGVSKSANGSIRVALFDKDGTNRANADFLGSFSVSRAGRGTRRISGNGSIYEVSYSAF